ncbi:MAG: hypothetical protein ACK5VE_06540 [Alphaproteobacteria bacterium]
MRMRTVRRGGQLYRVLEWMAAEGVPVASPDLYAQMGIHRNHASEIFNTLMRHGYAERVREASPRGAALYLITEAGRQWVGAPPPPTYPPYYTPIRAAALGLPVPGWRR